MSDHTGLKPRIDKKLSSDPRFKGSKIEVEVVNNKVILHGYVHSMHQLDTIQKAVWSSRGVRGIESKLSVLFPKSYVRPSDEAIKSSLTGLITTNPDIYFERIDINVSNGDVVLSGSVDSYYKKDIAAHCVKIVGGVVSIRNMLAVVPTRAISDESIGQSVLHALQTNDIADVNTISIEVSNGKVVISGSVAGRDTFEVVEDVVRYTDGVVDIDNRLLIA
jgi:osmotically-inducible protein OsmY